jgi:hypothetical protein
MQDHFSNLTEDQLNQISDAFPLITILVGEADGKLDSDEKAWAKELTHIRSYSHNESLRGLYDRSEARFDARLSEIRTQLPNDIAARTEAIHNQLAELNPVLASLDEEIGARLYLSLRSFAKHIASASGGFMRFFSVSGEEKAVLDLPTLNPINHPDVSNEIAEK